MLDIKWDFFLAKLLLTIRVKTIVLFTLTKGDGYFKDKMLERVNEAKTGIKKKLNLSPRRTTQKGSGTGPKEIDPFLLSIPEQNQ